jgi:c-di-GMP-binding flagellar brake protein YcgR
MTTDIVIKSAGIDYSHLVGREIKLRAEQFPNQILRTRVLAISDNNLVLDRSGSAGRIDQLVNNQNVEVIFDYRGEPAVFTSKITIPRTGRLQIPIASEVTPQVRRQFVRFPAQKDVHFTLVGDVNISFVRLEKLKWIESHTANLSGGGMLVELPNLFASADYMIFHLDMEEFSLPKLLIGKVRHRHRHDDRQSYAGVEFVTRDDRENSLPAGMIKNLPGKLFSFDRKMRDELATFLNDQYGNRF